MTNLLVLVESRNISLHLFYLSVATLTTLATEWRSLYHHEECERLVEDMTYQDICDAEDIISPNTTSSETTPPTTPTDAPGCVNTTGSDQSEFYICVLCNTFNSSLMRYLPLTK